MWNRSQGKVGVFDDQSGKSHGIVKEFWFTYWVWTLCYLASYICLVIVASSWLNYRPLQIPSIWWPTLFMLFRRITWIELGTHLPISLLNDYHFIFKTLWKSTYNTYQKSLGHFQNSTKNYSFLSISTITPLSTPRSP